MFMFICLFYTNDLLNELQLLLSYWILEDAKEDSGNLFHPIHLMQYT